jgi:hypothetical protein
MATNFIDLTGQRFGRLLVGYVTRRPGCRTFWHCLCDCGNTVEVEGSHLRNGGTQSCKCLAREKLNEGRQQAHDAKLIDITGERFGRLVARSIAEHRQMTHGIHVFWHCDCDCGNTKKVDGAKLRSGHTKSCGCISREMHYTHGQTLTAEYQILQGMIQRCYNPKHPSYGDYGGRGITVCDEWRYSFEAFYKAVGKRPSPQHSIERKNNELGYSPENVIWATQAVQTRNTRRNRLFTISGRTQCLQDWVNESVLPPGTVNTRLRLGWSIEEALNPETQNHLITHNGMTQSLAEWSRQTGINKTTIQSRLKRHWSIERTLTETTHQYTRHAQ